MEKRIMNRKVKHQIQGFPTKDGAGVSLVRVLGINTSNEYDPILMLDSFDSQNPEEYRAGFPMHPHRGIETISYVAKGKMQHRDSLGHSDTISDGEVQWMTAGSGILHEEMIPDSERLLGVQLWLNLPRADKMTAPAYHSIKREEIQEIPLEGGKLRLLAGTYKEYTGFQGKYLPLDYYDIQLEAGAKVEIETKEDRSVMVFTLLGEALVGGTYLPEKTAAKLTEGSCVEIQAKENGAQVLLISSKKIEEEIAWGGPIVMNTQKELQQAFAELSEGTFLKETMSYEE